MKKNKIDITKKIVPCKYTRVIQVDDIAIALSLKKMKYYELNIETFNIWKLLEKYLYPKKVIEYLSNKYELNVNLIEEDIKNICLFFINEQLWK